MPLDALYVDIWQNIARHLTANDILNLRLTNTAVNGIVSSDVIWSTFVNTRWFSIQDIPRGDYHNIENYLQYYIARSEKDSKTLSQLERIKSSDDIEFVMKAASIIINNDNIPLLLSLKRSNDDLRMKYLSTNLLNTIRRNQGISYLSKGFDKSDAEDFFFKMSYLDPSFDELLPYRTKILDEVSRTVRSGIIDGTFEKSPIAIVKATVDVLFKVCHCDTDHEVVQDNFSGNSTEEYSILRVYSGEVVGSMWIQYSIIQKISSLFGIKSTVSETFLVIEDASFNNGAVLLFLKGDKPQFISMNYLESLFLRQESEDTIRYITAETILKVWHHSTSIIEKSQIRYTASDVSLNIYPKSKSPFYSRIVNTLWIIESLKSTSKIGPHNPSVLQGIIEEQKRLFPFDSCIIDKENNRLHKSLPEDFFDFPHTHRYIPFTRANVPEPEFHTGQIVYSRHKFFGVILCPIYEEDITSNEAYTVTYKVLTIKITNSIWRSLQPVDEITEESLSFVKSFPLIGKYFDRFDPQSNLFIPNKFSKEKLNQRFIVDRSYGT